MLNRINFVRAFIVTLLLSIALISINTQASEEAAANKDLLAVLDKSLNAIQKKQLEIKNLGLKAGSASGITKQALELRRVKSQLELLEQNLSYITTVADQIDTITDVDKYRQQAADALTLQAETISKILLATRAQIVLPEAGSSAADKAAVYSRVFTLLDTLNDTYEVFISSLAQGKKLGIDVTKLDAKLKLDLFERAENSLALLGLAIQEVSSLRASAAVVPTDVEVKANLKVGINIVARLAAGLTRIVAMMDGLELDTTSYQKQLLATTGQITTNVFEADVLTNLLFGWGQTLWDGLVENGPGLVFKFILFLIIFFVFIKLANFARNLCERALQDSQVKLSQLLQRMVLMTVRNTILIIGVLIALSQMGISLGPLLAGIGVVGFIIGFALQDTLSNFAAGLLILVYRPFDVEDIIESGGVLGKVNDMSLVNTTLLTFDNQTIIIPNNKVWGDVIKNVTAQNIRRVDLIFGIGYSDDIPKAEKILQEIINSQTAVLNNPETIIRLHELGDSSVNFVVRPWVNRDDYWETYWAITRAVKLRFDEEGISIPFPQRDVHIHNT